MEDAHHCEDIFNASQKGHLKCIEAVLKKGAYVNAIRLLSEAEIKEKQQLEDKIGGFGGYPGFGYFRTPLILAAENGHAL